MAQCAYPTCKVQIESGGDSPPLFCVDHEGRQCVFPPCQESVIPGSGWCQEHNALVVFFDFVHGIRHQEAVQRQAQAEQAQRIMKQGGLRPGGNGNVRLLRP